MNLQGFALHDPEALRSFRNGLAPYYNGNDDNRQGNRPSNGITIRTNACLREPRIAMLTREMTAWGRRMPNEQAVAKGIADHLQSHHSIQQANVPLVQFANYSFLDQMSFFSSVDILVAAHGAQNIGVGFMPQCGGIIEMFPQGIQFVNYFGTLAPDSGIEYMLYYVSDANFTVDRTERGHTFNRGLRRNDICPVPEDLFGGVDQMIQIWRSCCEEKKNEGQKV
ncbi:MAG: hypothetical protein SGILL_006638 [Bacillariaceae sp.]